MTWADTKQALCNFWPPAPSFTPDMYPKLEGQVVVVTGGNTGVGYQTVKLLIPTGAKIYIFSRSEERIVAAIDKLKTEFPNAYLDYVTVDFNDLTSIKPAVAKFTEKEQRLDVIVHNAGVMELPKGTKTAQGFEAHLGINAIGPLLLHELLTPIITKTAAGRKPGDVRALFLTSTYHFQSSPKGFDKLHVNDLNRNSVLNYCDSKSIIGILGVQWSLLHPEVPAFIVDPGYAKTDLQRHLTGIKKYAVSPLLNDPITSGYTVAYAALSPELGAKDNGAYIVPQGRVGKWRDDVRETCFNEDGKWLREWFLKQVEPFM